MRTFSPLLLCAAAFAQAPPKSIHPTVQKIVDEISPERVGATMRKLGSFGTRHVESPITSDARAWMAAEMRAYSPRLQVRSDGWTVKKMPRTTRPETEVVNVLAVLPGKTDPASQILLTAHYDTIAFARGAGGVPPGSLPQAPGVADNASGVAAVMEMARVMSQYEFDKTLVFIAFDGEEQGLVGASLHAQRAAADKDLIEAVLNIDTIGSDLSGNGFRATHAVRVFSEEPADSPSRALARYVREVGERYVPSMRIDSIFRRDRFGRGGDHTAFHQRGFAAVRFTTPAEQLQFQHSPNDSFENSAPDYAARVTQVTAAAAASLALAPRPPIVRTANGGLTLTRGQSQYDAVARWRSEGSAPAGYALLLRATTAPFWEKEIYVGQVTGYTLKNTSIDDIVIGVRAYSKDGVESLVSSYEAVNRPQRDYDAAPLAR